MSFSSSTLTAVKQATIEFTESQKTLAWSEADGCLLFFAEAQGIPARSGCRSGYCGACTVELLAGQVVYEGGMSVELADNEVAMCSAKPASSFIKLKI